MQQQGYKTQEELNKDEEGGRISIRDAVMTDEPRLAVGRNNEPLRCGGNHRIAAAQALDLDYIYVYVVLWHESSCKEDFISKYGKQ